MSTQHSQISGWKPEPGDSITGRIEDISEHDAGYGKYPILELATETGTVAVHAFHDVLRNELARRAPNIGDTLTITYRGKHPGKGYHQYRVRDGDGRGSGINWAKYGTEDTPEPPASDLPSDFDTGYGKPSATDTPAAAVELGPAETEETVRDQEDAAEAARTGDDIPF